MDEQPVFLFDFDGTIADTFHHLIGISNQLSGEFGFKPIRPDDIDGLKDLHVHEIIQKLEIPLLKVPAIVTKAKHELHKQIDSVRPVEGLKNVLGQIKGLGAKIGILTSNSSKNVHAFLKNNGFDIFDFIQPTPKIWSKNRSIRNLVAEKNLDPDRVTYIGDETRDIIAAHKAGVRSVAVTWGYNSSKALRAVNPHFMIDRPGELLELPR